MRRNHVKNGTTTSLRATRVTSRTRPVAASGVKRARRRDSVSGIPTIGPDQLVVPSALRVRVGREAEGVVQHPGDVVGSGIERDQHRALHVRHATGPTVTFRRSPTMPTLAAGDRAPAFTLIDQHGKKVKLSDFKGRNVVLYFYPKADTPGCTTQSCALRDAEPDLSGSTRWCSA